MYRLFPIIVSVLVLASCRSESVPVVSFDEIIKYETISHTESLKSEDVSHEIPFASIDFRIIDTLCIFSANDPDNGFFKICGLSGFSTTLDVVKRGNGPNELLWYQYFNEIAFRHESDSLIAYMRNNKRQIIRWNVSETLRSGVNRFETVSESFSGTLSSIYIDESLVFVTRLNSSETGVERFLYKNGNLEAPSHLEKLSDKKVMVNDGTSFNVLSMIYSYNPYHGKVVEAGTVQNIINIYSLDGVFKKSVRIGKPSEFDIKDRMTWPMSYEHMDLYDEFIAALFVDDTSYNHSLKAEVLPVIRILDWEGTPLLELKLDKHATNFEFDFKNMKLYTLNSNDESFYEYDVSSLYLKYPQIFKNE